MRELVYEGEYFRPADTLGCGQVFRYRPFREGYLVFSAEKACYIFESGGKTHIVVNEGDEAYFENYFDVRRDYADIVKRAKSFGSDCLAAAAERGKGIRILRQDAEETLFSFIVSQNNRIPRIRAVIGNICAALGAEHTFMGEKYFSFPPAQALAEKDAKFYADCGAGYRAAYISETAKAVAKEGLGRLSSLRGAALRNGLMRYKGVGAKVADCVALFGFSDTGAFPVDTWIEKVYREDFGGKEKDREKIAAYFADRFGENGGYIQQYLFYYKRGREVADGKHNDR